MSSGFANMGERLWVSDEVPKASYPFKPIALRVRDNRGHIVDVVRSIEPVSLEVEYKIDEPIQGLRIGLYLVSMRGEYVFTTFDTDDPQKYEKYGVREPGHYVSRCVIPPDTLNEGRYALGMNASSFRVKRYFMEEHSLAFSVDGMGAPGKQWAEPRMGIIRPRLEWVIEEQG
jgi:lipopolysaccharide transport system ATP-binding protein